MNGQRESNGARLPGEVWAGRKEDDVRSDEEIGDRLHVSGDARTNAEPRSANAVARSHVPGRTATQKRETHRDQDVDLHEQVGHVTNAQAPSARESQNRARDGQTHQETPTRRTRAHAGTHAQKGESQVRFDARRPRGEQGEHANPGTEGMEAWKRRAQGHITRPRKPETVQLPTANMTRTDKQGGKTRTRRA